METAGSASYDDEPSSKSLDPHFGVTRTAIPEHADETALPKPACLRGCAKSWVLAVLALGVGLMLQGFPGLRSCHSW